MPGVGFMLELPIRNADAVHARAVSTQMTKQTDVTKRVDPSGLGSSGYGDMTRSPPPQNETNRVINAGNWLNTSTSSPGRPKE